MPFRRDDVDHRPPRRIGHDVDRILAGLGAPPAPVLTRITERWAELVGPVAAEHCRPGRLVDGRLHVEVDAPAWASQMRWQQATVVGNIAEMIPDAGVEALVAQVKPSGDAPAGR